MPTHRLPVYVWSDPQGTVYALPVDADHFYSYEQYDSVVAPDVAHALKQVQEGLRQHIEAARRKGEEIQWPEAVEYELKTVAVDARPRYEKDGRLFPLNDKIVFQLPVLVGKEPVADDKRQHQLRCCMPTIKRWFSCFESDDYRRIAGETYRETLYGFSPEEILLDVPVPKGKIMYVSIRDRNRPPRRIARHFEHLERIARPLLSDLKRGAANAYGREAELSKLIAAIRDTRRNIALLAPEGTGRATLLAAAVRHIERRSQFENKNEEPDPGGFLPVKHRFWTSTAANLISGTKYLGQWQEQISGVIDDLAGFDGVLCLDNLAELARLGGEAEESVAAFLTPYLEAGTLRLIGKITPRELEVLQHRCGDFIDKFSLFPLEPLGIGETTAALQQLGDVLCREKSDSGTVIDDDVPLHLVRLVRRFCPYDALPGAPARLLRRLVAKTSRGGPNRIDLQRTTQLFLEETGLPAALLNDSEPLSFENVRDYFSRNIIGQEAGCESVAQAIVNFKASMNDPQRPIRSLLFYGPTGVGKTQLAKTLADYLFGNGPITKSERKTPAASRFFRVDMSEYMHPWSATRLIEQENGTPSALIRHVRLKPFSVVLFDEIEKASPEVFDLLLGLLDEGRLTDRFGRTTSFQSTIVIMTSNLGGHSSSIGFGGTATSVGGAVTTNRHDSRFLKAVRDHFRPEFFNRIDDIVPFRTLDRDSCRRIIVHELQKLGKREGLAVKKREFVPTERLIERLLASGFDSKYGARPLQREIESFVLPLLAAWILRPETATESGEYFRLVASES